MKSKKLQANIWSPFELKSAHTASICNNLQAIGKSHFPWLYTKMWGRLDTVWLAPLLL